MAGKLILTKLDITAAKLTPVQRSYMQALSRQSVSQPRSWVGLLVSVCMGLAVVLALLSLTGCVVYLYGEGSLLRHDIARRP